MRYSKVFKSEDGKKFRYNYEKCELEFITTIGVKEDEFGDFVKFNLVEPEVIISSGLALDNWKESNKYWVEIFAEEIRQESRELRELEEKF